MPDSNARFALPDDLPVPKDDGATDHLPGIVVPPLILPATNGQQVDLRRVGRPRAIIYLYPRTGEPDVPPPDGWDLIPGARGCTPEACGFRDHHAELRTQGAEVFGLSSQSTDYQAEAVARLHLPFPLLSDERHRLAEALGLPTFEFQGTRLYRRLTLVVRDGLIEHVFYPIFPPDRHAEEVLNWLRAN